LKGPRRKVLFLILIIYEINDIGVQNTGKLTGMNAEGAALAPSAGESPIHHSFGVFLARPRAGLFYGAPGMARCAQAQPAWLWWPRW
jgi:hypothetical protein